jgi:hypothetical protein
MSLPDDEKHAELLPEEQQAQLPDDVIGADVLAAVTHRKYMRNMLMQEFYDLYVSWTESAPPASKSTFQRCYVPFKKYLGIASKTEHGKCTVCEHLKELKRKAITASQRSEVEVKHADHVKAVMADRKADMYVQQLGFESCTVGC